MRGAPKDFGAQLARGYWSDVGSIPRKWEDARRDGLTVDLGGLDAAGRRLANWALDAWSVVSGIDFTERRSGADISFEDYRDGAETRMRFTPDGDMIDAEVNVPRALAAGAGLGSRGYKTYLHEIGHALGLGHSGGYDGERDHSARMFDNDTTLMTVMSYFTPKDDPGVGIDFARPVTLMPGDVAAIRALYGTARVEHGDTVYGHGGNASGPLGLALAIAAGERSNGGQSSDTRQLLTIVDTGGTDTIDLAGFGGAAQIDLREGAWTTIGGRGGGITIAEGSVIENAYGGAKGDSITGNETANRLRGEGGDDRLYGRGGNDAIGGGAGDDRLYGHSGRDALYGHEGADMLHGGSGDDRLYGGGGNDRLSGSDDDDDLHGQSGWDRLYGGTGEDDLDGGTGNDRLYGGSGNDRLRGGEQDDKLYGENGNDALFGDGGRDVLYGGIGKDNLYGSGGSDRLYGGGWGDRLFGGSGNDRMRGGSSDDYLSGGDGRDVLLGDGGDDRLRGGRDGDTFTFADGFGRDAILDFDARDRIDLREVSAITSYNDLRRNHLEVSDDGAVIDDGRGNTITVSGLDFAFSEGDFIL